MRVATALVLVLVVAACDDPPAGSPDGGEEDAGPVGGDAGAAACPAVASADGPFGATFRGSVTFDAACRGIVGTPMPREDTVDLAIYFPEGRVPGARVLLAVQDVYPRPGLVVVEATLDDELRARFPPVETTNWHDRDTWIAAALGRDGNIDATIERNMSDHDVVDCRAASVVLCPDLPPPEPVFTARLGRFAPAATLWLAPSVPADGLAITATADGEMVALDVGLAVESVYVRPVAAFPPGSDVVFDASSTLDVLGRPFTMAAPAEQLTVTDVVTDFSLDTEPPDGAIAGIVFEWGTGGLMLGRPLNPDPWMALIGLSEPPSGTIAARIPIATLGAPSRGALVDTSGVVSRFEVPGLPGKGPLPTVTVPVPGRGPLWLSLDHDLVRWHPQWAAPRYEVGVVRIGGISFE